MITQKEIASLTGLRFVLAFWVLMYHSADMASGGIGYFFGKGYLGVDFFFVLSGFILAYAYERDFLSGPPGKGATGAYFKNRFARVYPVHFFTLLFSIAFLNFLRWWGELDYSMPYHELPYHFLLLHAWGFINPLYWNDPSWSISAEMFAYIFLFPANAFLIRRYGRKISLLTTLAGLLVLLYVSEVVLDRPGFLKHARYGIVRILPEFLLGMSIYLYRTELLNAIRRYAWAWWLMTAACLVIIYLWEYDYFILPVVVFTIIGLLQPGTAAYRWLSGKKLVYFGHVSYSLYMVQLFALHTGHILTPKAGQWLGQIPGYQPWMFFFPCTIAVCLLMAIACKHLVEDPSRRWIRSWGKSGGKV